MKLITRKEYYELSSGSVVSIFDTQKNSMTELFIKICDPDPQPANGKCSIIKSLSKPITEPEISYTDTEILEVLAKVNIIFDEPKYYEWDYNCTERLDTFGEIEMESNTTVFVLWEKKDVKKLIEILQESLQIANEDNVINIIKYIKENKAEQLLIMYGPSVFKLINYDINDFSELTTNDFISHDLTIVNIHNENHKITLMLSRLIEDYHNGTAKIFIELDN